jgi:hypothetical protein
MGGKSSKSSSPQMVVAPSNNFDMDKYTAEIEATIKANNEKTMKMLEELSKASEENIPEITPPVVLDYSKENQALRDKIDAQNEAEDSKRKGVLGTILTQLEDDPDTVTSLLGGLPDEI